MSVIYIFVGRRGKRDCSSNNRRERDEKISLLSPNLTLSTCWESLQAFIHPFSLPFSLFPASPVKWKPFSVRDLELSVTSHYILDISCWTLIEIQQCFGLSFRVAEFCSLRKHGTAMYFNSHTCTLFETKYRIFPLPYERLPSFFLYTPVFLKLILY